MRDAIKPVITVKRTQAAIAEQGYTYNETGFTYDQIIQYGGLYGKDIYPILQRARNIKTVSTARLVKPSVSVARTGVAVKNDGFTYNEASFVYNQAIAYGGLYGKDIIPLVARARDIKPKIVLGMDFGASVIPPTPSGRRGQLIGMLGMTYAS